MAFGNPYQPGYMPNYYPIGQPSAMPDQLAQLRQNYQQPTQQPTPIIWVQGEEGAKAYMVAAGNSVLLMDSENSVFYIKSTDASGMPQPLRVFDYTERGKQATQKAEIADDKFVTRAEFDALRARFDALTADKPGKGASNAKSTV